MTTDRKDDLRAFRDFVDVQLAGGGHSLDECLALWEYENTSDRERGDTVEALREALADMRAGDTGVPAREFLAELRRKHNLPAKP